MAGTTGRGRGTALAAVLAAAALLAACGGEREADPEGRTDPEATTEPGGEPGAGDPGTGETPSEGTEEEPTEEVVDPGEVELPELEGYPDLTGQSIEIATSWSDVDRHNLETVLDAFEQATGAEVHHLGIGNPRQSITESVEDGVPPNIAVVRDPELVAELAADGTIVPLADTTVQMVEDSYAQTWLDLGSWDDEVYAVWLEAASKSTVWYNAQVYEDAGAEVPTTWEEFRTTLETVSGSGVAGLSVGADTGWPLSDWFENVYLATAGPEMYDRLTAHEIPWTDPSVVEALEVLAELWGDEDLQLAGGTQRTYPDAVTTVFGDEPTAGTLVGGDYIASSILGQTDAVVGEDALSYPWPQLPGTEPSVVGDASGAVAFDDDEATAALMRYLASPEAANVWIELGGIVSPNRAADLDLYADDAARASAEQITSTEVFRFDLSDLVPLAFGASELQGIWPILIDFYADPSDPAATAQELEDAAVEFG